VFRTWVRVVAADNGTNQLNGYFNFVLPK